MSHLPRVIFLANDAVLTQGLAFLESFRATNPGLRLSMIPFADDIDQFKRLRGLYDFDILETDVGRWDALAQALFPGSAKKYQNRLRKLSGLDAAAPATIYLDIDTVVLRDLTPLVQPILDGRFDVLCIATKNDPWVYKRIYRQVPRLRGALRFSDGFLAFNPAKLNADLAYQTMVKNRALYLRVRAEHVYCQPVTNFVVDMLGLKVGPLFRVCPHISRYVWYGDPQLSCQNGGVVSYDGKNVIFIHWAGPVDMDQDFRMKALFEMYLGRARDRVAASALADQSMARAA